MLYLVTYYQNPTGRTTSFAKKEAALALLSRYEKAAGHPIYLLEDAAYRELRFAGEDTPSALLATKFAERVVYAGTFSKPFATGVRVGFGWMPELLRTAVVRAKGNHDFGTSNLLQQLLCRALTSGRFEAHLTELRKRYARKAGIMERAMREHFPKSVTWETAQGGLYFWPRVKGLTTGNRSKLFQTALQRNVLYIPGQVCYADDPARRKPNHEMRLSFGGASETNIREGIARLGRVLHELLEE
jgi:2-aminoadipate transaminase